MCFSCIKRLHVSPPHPKCGPSVHGDASIQNTKTQRGGSTSPTWASRRVAEPLRPHGNRFGSEPYGIPCLLLRRGLQRSLAVAIWDSHRTAPLQGFNLNPPPAHSLSPLQLLNVWKYPESGGQTAAAFLPFLSVRADGQKNAFDFSVNSIQCSS